MNALFEKILPFFKHKIVFYGGLICVLMLIISALFMGFTTKNAEHPSQQENPDHSKPLDEGPSTHEDSTVSMKEKDTHTPPEQISTEITNTSPHSTAFTYAPFTLKEKSHEGLILIITDLGLDPKITECAIRELPSSVVLAFSSYTKTINPWIQPARAAGHHVLLQIHKEDNSPHMNILTYFDGVMFIEDDTPIRDRKKLRTFLEELDDKRKIIVEGRLLKKNILALENNRFETDNGKSVPLYFITHTLTEESIFLDKQDIFKMKGIVTFPAILVPYLIDLLEKNLDKADPLQPLLKTSA